MTTRYEDIAGMIDHALLSPTLSVDELEAGISLAARYQVASVCILPYSVARCAERLAGTQTLCSTTIGFPHGGTSTSAKVAEAVQAVADGCQELDMVVNISLVRSHLWADVQRDLQAVIEVAHASSRKVKVIFENCYLHEAEKIHLAEICGEVHADWIKTSTGFGTSGAIVEDVLLMRKHAPAHVQVKAAGGIRDLSTLLRMRELGATRIGTSQTQAILEECRKGLRLPSLASAATAAVDADY